MICGICQKKQGTNKLKDTFTDCDYLPSKVFCEECFKLFDTEWLKTCFYWTKKEKRKIKQCDFEKILNNLEFPCLLSFSESRKKHRLFRTKWSATANKVYVSTDTGEVILNMRQDLPIFNYLCDFYRNNKISKSWIVGEFPAGAIKQIGIPKYLEFLQKVKKIKGTQKFELLVKFLNK